MSKIYVVSPANNCDKSGAWTFSKLKNAQLKAVSLMDHGYGDIVITTSILDSDNPADDITTMLASQGKEDSIKSIEDEHHHTDEDFMYHEAPLDSLKKPEVKRSNRKKK